MKGNNQAYKLWLCLLCSFLLLPLEIQAQEKGDSITGKVHKIDEVTVTARRTPAKVTSTIPVQTLSRQDISQLGIQNMADAVRRFAGANVKDYGGIGGLKTVSIRNMGAAHTAVSYDGVTVSNCQAGQIDIGRFSLDNVSMLSLAIGQNEDMLQSARLYASAGVLNIEIEKPHFTNERNYAFQTQIKGGSFGYVSPSVRWWQKINKRTRLSVDGMFLRADGNYPFILVNGKYVTKEKRNNSDIYSLQGEANLYHSFKDESELDVKGYYFIPNEDFREPSLYIIPLLMKHYGMKMPLYKHVTKSISHPNGVCKHKPSIIMDGISMKIWEPNIRTESTMPNTDKTNIIFRQPYYIIP